MKIVNLAGPAVIDGAVRYPVEGPLTVTDTAAKQLEDSGRLDGEPEDLPELDADEDEEGADDLSGLSIPKLKKVAEDETVDLGGATTKDAIADAIRAHRRAAAGE